MHRAVSSPSPSPHRHGPAGSWFVVVPDTPRGSALAGALDPARASGRPLGRGAVPAPRASGRPWLVGSWPDGDLVTVAAGTARLALIGCAPLDESRAWDWLARARTLADLDRLVDALPGSWHLVAEIDGRVRVQGTASGLRRVFHARLPDGSTLAGDRADVVAAAAGLDQLDDKALALSLLDPVAPHPLDDRPLWRGLTAVPPDHWLGLDRSGCHATHHRWWSPPEPCLDLEEGAAALRHALIEAVDARTAPGGVVTADLSGGQDSTALCFLAAAGASALVPCTGVSHDPADDDVRWAATARALLLGADAAGAPPGSAYELLTRDEVPLVYDGIDAADEALDRPFVGLIDRAKLLACLGLAARHEPRLHLCGLGGDEIAQGSPSYLAGLARAHPLATLGQLRGLRALYRWPLAASAATALRRRDYRDWLSDLVWPARWHAQAWRRCVPPVAELDWAVPPRPPAWLSLDGTALVRAALIEAAAAAEPLAPTRDRHGDLWAVRVGAAVARGFAQLASGHGPPLALPFYDDRVVTAALAVRPAERSAPWEYKPLLRRAMRPLVPEACLRRQTKAEGSAEEEPGLRANQAALRALFRGSRLAGMGLVDEDRLLEACRYSSAPDAPHLALQQTAAAESWLRAGSWAGQGRWLRGDGAALARRTA